MVANTPRNPMIQTVLVVDDESGIRELLAEILREEGYQPILAETAEEANVIRRDIQPNLVLLDIWMPQTDGLSLLKEWGEKGWLTMPVVMMSGHATIDIAVEATKMGAYDILEKPIALVKLLGVVKQALQASHGIEKQSLDQPQGQSPALLTFTKRLKSYQRRSEALLFLAESGVNLEWLPHYFLYGQGVCWFAQQEDWLRANPFLALSLPPGSIIFVENVETFSKEQMNNLNRLATKLDRTRLRLVSVSTVTLPNLQETLGPALFPKLSEVVCSIPSLREYGADISRAAQVFWEQWQKECARKVRPFTDQAYQFMTTLAWPGNDMSLRQMIRTLSLLSDSTEIGVSEVKEFYALQNQEKEPQQTFHATLLECPLREAREEFERWYLSHHLKWCQGQMSILAERTGIERTHLYRKLKHLGISLKD